MNASKYLNLNNPRPVY